MELKAYHGKLKIKKFYLDRVRKHREADEIVKGVYWEDGRGCAVGCCIHSNNHAAYEVELGIPQILARLEDGIFENLPNDLAKDWPEQFLEAITPGADLSLVWPKFAHWMLVDPQDGVIRFAQDDKTRKAIQDVADLYAIQAQGNPVAIEKWSAARTAACAAESAARTAACAAESAARTAAWAAECAAESAARTAAWAAECAECAECAAESAAWAAESAARTAAWAARTAAFYIKCSHKLLELLKESGTKQEK